MQSSFSLGCPARLSFKKRKFEAARLGLTIDGSLAKPIARPYWAALPSPPMSGSPPPDDIVDPPQLAGRRRKREETPPVTSGVILPPLSASSDQSPYPGSVARPRSGPSLVAVGAQPSSYEPSYFPQSSYSYGSSLPMVSGPAASIEPRYTSTPVSPRATRKTKAHVASACVNCKNKHLRCDSARPCRRCVANGKEDTCFDVEHRKRGRPPLKADDSGQRRAYEATITPLPTPGSGPMRRPAADTSSYPPLSGSYDHGRRGGHRASQSDLDRTPYGARMPYQPLYGVPTVSAHQATALGTMFHPSATTPSIHPPPSYFPSSTSRYDPISPIVQPQPISYLPNYTYQQQQPTQHQQPHRQQQQQQQQQQLQPIISPSQQTQQSQYGFTLFPPSMTRSTPQPSHAPPPNEPSSISLYGPGGLTLPPIRPAPTGSNIEPAMAQQQQRMMYPPQQPPPPQQQQQRQQQILQQQQQGLQQQGQQVQQQQLHDQGTIRQPDPKRPRMDIKGILGPRQD